MTQTVPRSQYEHLEEQADTILKYDRARHRDNYVTRERKYSKSLRLAAGDGKSGWDHPYGILTPHSVQTIRKREMPVGLRPDPSVRRGQFNRKSNIRQVWLNGHLTGYTHPARFDLDGHNTPLFDRDRDPKGLSR